MTATDPATLLAGAMRADQAADDWRAKVRADVDQLVRDIDDQVDDVDQPATSLGLVIAEHSVTVYPPACSCPDSNGYCREDCAHCAGLPDSAPCPGDVVDQGDDDAAEWHATSAMLADVAPELVPAFDATNVTAVRARLDSPAVVPTMVRGPGWTSRHDAASRRFAVVDRLAGKAPLRDVWLPATPVLNQGAEGACVGFGVADAVNVLRVQASHGESVPLLTDADALDLYHAAQRVDDVPGESYVGTSVLAGMKAGQAAGDFAGYLWDFGTSAIAQTLLQLHAPVVVGVPWSEAMYETGPGGLVRLGGKVVGGHCLAIVGLVMKGPQGQAGPFFIWRNSWGEGYGVHGDGWVHHRDLATLLHQQGEAAVPTTQPQVTK